MLRQPNNRIGYNSVSMGDKSEILVPNGVFGVSHLIVSFKVVPEQPLLMCNENWGT